MCARHFFIFPFIPVVSLCFTSFSIPLVSFPSISLSGSTSFIHSLASVLSWFVEWFDEWFVVVYLVCFAPLEAPFLCWFFSWLVLFFVVLISFHSSALLCFPQVFLLFGVSLCVSRVCVCAAGSPNLHLARVCCCFAAARDLRFVLRARVSIENTFRLTFEGLA